MDPMKYYIIEKPNWHKKKKKLQQNDTLFKSKAMKEHGHNQEQAKVT